MSSAVAFPIFESNVGPVKVVQHLGSKSLKEKVIPKVCSGDLVVGIAMSEPDAGLMQTFNLI
jgi:alkylation response protein AidB-like acyl-CoA dehydrogenase